ncbi:peptidoglycan-binding domain-containing protein [Bacillus pumilus]|uniref:peptidoglycan-binding domain-containing protein n=1 Tax=Bacillus pumilus TaxID=1408 RepID=UPI0035E3E53F
MSAIKSFQKQQGLTADGIAGPQTRAALDRKAKRGTAAGKNIDCGKHSIYSEL